MKYDEQERAIYRQLDTERMDDLTYYSSLNILVVDGEIRLCIMCTTIEFLGCFVF